MIAFLVACAMALGFSHPRLKVVEALVTACDGDLTCAEDGIVYAARESSFEEHPQPWSWDSKAGVSCGEWQTPCATLKLRLVDRARDWVAMRKASLDAYGDLRGLPGNTPAGIRIAKAREEEREDAIFAAETYEELPK